MSNIKCLGQLLLASIALTGILGCGGDSPRQVQESSDQSFQDVAAMIEQENAASEVEE